VKVEFLPQADRDLDAIFDPLYTRVVSRILALGDYPELGAPMGGAYGEYRSTVVEFFRIVYRLRTDEVVEITFIRDCRRRLRKRP
jgi:plasmid stabilization system protein ParE